MKTPLPENRCTNWGVSMRMMLRPLRLAAALVFALALHPSHAAMGDLDTSFGNGGDVFDGLGANAFEYGDAAVQPDGKIVAVGTCTFSGSVIASLNGKYFCAKRYEANGAIDSSFATNGFWSDRDSSATGIFRSYDSLASSVLILSDGKILIGGTCRSNQACMARLTNAGVRDIPFMRETTYAAVPASPTTRLAETASGNYLIHYSRVAASGDRQLMTVANFTPGGVPNVLFGANNDGVFVEGFSSPNNRYSPKGIVTLGDAMWLGGEIDSGFGRYLRLHLVTKWGVSDQSGGLNTIVSKYLGVAGGGQTAVFSIGTVLANGASDPRITASVITDGKLGVYRMDTTGYADDTWFAGGLKATTITAVPPDPACIYFGGMALPVGGYVFTGAQFRPTGTGVGATIAYCVSQFDATLTPLVTGRVAPANGPTVYAAIERVWPVLGREGRILVAGACRYGNGAMCMQRYDILPTNCYDMDGDGSTTPGVDGVILARLLAGFSGNNLLYGLALPSGATRNTAALIQTHYNSCQYSQYSSCYRVSALSYVSAKGLLYDGLPVIRAQQGLRGEALRLGDGNYIAKDFMGYACGFRELLR